MGRLMSIMSMKGKYEHVNASHMIIEEKLAFDLFKMDGKFREISLIQIS